MRRFSGDLALLFTVLVLAPMLAGGAVSAEQPLAGKRLDRIAFGSCAKQVNSRHASLPLGLLPQPIWQGIGDTNPDLWLWLGDAVYTKADRANHSSLASMREMYALQRANPAYAAFRSRRPGMVVDGVWDDHDYGVNDAGKEIWTKGRQDLFLDFIGVPTTSERRGRQGVYFSRVFGSVAEGGTVQIVGLDTRSLRDHYLVPSIGGWSTVPLAAVIAAGVRFASVRLGLSADYDGDVLGEAQWRWLEHALGSTVADVTIVLSSVQVLTSNGLVESWGHFPRAQRRLLALLEKERPTGLLLLSGDVHFAEMAGSDLEHVVEVTSSGLTHSCTTPWFGPICGPVVRTFSGHRAGAEAVFTKKNFGGVELDWERRRFTVTVFDEHGQPAPGMVVHRDMDDGSIRPASLGGATVADMQESPVLYGVLAGLAGLGVGTLCLLRQLCCRRGAGLRRGGRKCKSA